MAHNANLSEQRLNILKHIAVLRSLNVSQQDIAKRLGLSQSAVSKFIQQALRLDLLRQGPLVTNFDDADKIVGELLGTEELEKRLLELKERDGWAILPKIHVSYASRYREPTQRQEEEGQAMRQWDEAVVRWGKAVAKPICALLSRSNTIGICWGRQIRSVVDGIQALGPERIPVEVAPMWGQRLTLQPEPDDAVFTDHLRLSCNRLAADLATALNHSNINRYKYYMPVFDLIPINEYIVRLNDTRISEAALKEHMRNPDLGGKFDEEGNVKFPGELRETLESIEAYRLVFGPQDDSFVRRMEVVIASVGAGGRRAFGTGESDNYGNIPLKWLRDCALGDIGGILLLKPSDKLPKGRDKTVVRWQFEQIRRHWTGVRIEHLKSCAIRADREGRPGVIVLAVGARRAEVTLACMKQGLINHLFSDNMHAQELKKLVESELHAVRGHR